VAPRRAGKVALAALVAFLAIEAAKGSPIF
jgi:hypothetical protein